MVGEEEEAPFIQDFDHFTVAGLYKRITYIYLKCEPKNRAGYDEERVKEIGTPEDNSSQRPQNQSVGGLTAASANLGGDPPPIRFHLLAVLLAQLVSRA